MAWDQVTTVSGRNEPLYFGPLSGYDTAELDRRGLDQDKKDTKGFKWVSKKDKTSKAGKPGKPIKAWDDPPPTPESGQGHTKGEGQGSEFKKKDPDDVPSWDEFTQTTTFHGVRYIFDKTPFKIRRILWLCVVTVAILLFVGQVGSRVAVYFQYKSNVAVKVTYVDEITFPSVTICNQNNYRTTDTVRWNLYDFIDVVFSAVNVSDIDLSGYNLDVDTSDFITSTAHQKINLIHRCTWQNKPCDIEKDFNLTVTDLGVCYTFNIRPPTLTTREPGSSTGLGLILNVEQYEYMRGPQNDAGVKIHLHDQGDIPQMKDLGFAVAPGTHTLVAVKRTEVLSLPEPFGKCEALNPVPVSECQLHCKTEKIIQECGCHDIYMEGHQKENSSSSICDMKQKFICVPLELRKISQQFSECNCLVPCKRVRYEPNLSYAQLSRINVERLIIETDTERQQLETKFHNAMETSQTVVKEIVTNDNKQITDLLESMKNLAEILNKSYAAMQDFGKLAELVKAPDVLSGNVVPADETIIKNWVDSLTSVYVSVNPNFDYLWQWQVPTVEEAMLFSDGGHRSRGLQFLLFCNGTISSMDWVEATTASTETTTVADTNVTTSDNGTNVTTIEAPLQPISPETSPYSWANVQNRSECAAAFYDMKDTANSNYDDIENDLRIVKNQLIQNQYATYNSELQKFGNSSTLNLSSIEEHVKCSGLEQNITEMDDLFILITELGANLSTSTNYHDAYRYAVQIPELYRKRKQLYPDEHNYDQMNDDVSGSCNWISSFVSQTKSDANSYLEAFIRIKDNHDAALRLFEQVTFYFNKLNDEVKNKIQPTVNRAQEYVDGKMSKVQLAEAFDEPYFIKADQDLSDYNTDMVSITKDFVEDLVNGRNKLLEFYQKFFTLKMPVLNSDNVHELEFVKISASFNESRMSELVEGLKTDFKVKLPELITESYARLMNPTREIADTVDLVLTNIEILTENLNTYKSSTKMNTDFFMENFMQVDIFYQEISYEEIEQNVAFEFLSLLSEVGGFLGLLLGASVLTVCELVDYISLSFINKLNAQKKVAPVNIER